MTAVAAGLSGVVGLSGCAVSAAQPGSGNPRLVTAVATISAWGSILAQLGGSHVEETSIVTSPNTDPHDYEPTPADARTIASAQLVVENGAGYDPWAARVVAANPVPDRPVINVGRLVGVPEGGNPHAWYSPSDVDRVARTITADLVRLDPADAVYFRSRAHRFHAAGLATYNRLIESIHAKYAGVPVGASESIFVPLSQALGLDLVTPPGFLEAISEGSEPSTADKATVDRQIRDHAIEVYVFNAQNATPDVTEQVAAARAQGIPVVPITETLSPATATYQSWQVRQLEALASALHQATGR